MASEFRRGGAQILRLQLIGAIPAAPGQVLLVAQEIGGVAVPVFQNGDGSVVPIGGGPAVSATRILGTYTVGGGGVAVRDVVYESSSDTVDRADANDVGTVPVIGIVESITGPTCEVAYFGELGGFAALTPNATLFLSDVPGQITETPLTEIGAISQKIGFVKNSTTIVVMIDRDFTEL